MKNGSVTDPAGEQNRTKNFGRGRMIAFMIVSVVLAVGAFVPVLVNGLVSNRLNWSLYPLGAIIMTWLILAPWFVLRRHRAVTSWGMAVITVPLFLLLVESLSPVKGWFISLGLPAAVVALVGLGGIIWLWCYSRIHPLYAAASTFLIMGMVSLSEQMVAHPFLFPDPYEWIRSLVTFSLGGMAVLLALVASFVRGGRVRKNS